MGPSGLMDALSVLQPPVYPWPLSQSDEAMEQVATLPESSSPNLRTDDQIHSMAPLQPSLQAEVGRRADQHRTQENVPPKSPVAITIRTICFGSGCFHLVMILFHRTVSDYISINVPKRKKE